MAKPATLEEIKAGLQQAQKDHDTDTVFSCTIESPDLTLVAKLYCVDYGDSGEEYQFAMFLFSANELVFDSDASYSAALTTHSFALFSRGIENCRFYTGVSENA